MRPSLSANVRILIVALSSSLIHSSCEPAFHVGELTWIKCDADKLGASVITTK